MHEGPSTEAGSTKLARFEIVTKKKYYYYVLRGISQSIEVCRKNPRFILSAYLTVVCVQ